MLAFDELLIIFQFLDYSHIPTLALISSDWNQVATSNRLWQYYFKLMAGSSFDALIKDLHRTHSSWNESTEEEDQFWMNLMRDEFSTIHHLKHETTIATNGEPDWSFLSSFNNGTTRQFLKFMVNRIIVKEVYYGTFDQLEMEPLKNSSKLTELLSEENFEVKMVFSILGLTDLFVFRRNYSMQSFDLMFKNKNKMYLSISTLAQDMGNEMNIITKKNTSNGIICDVRTSGVTFDNTFVYRRSESKTYNALILHELILPHCIPVELSKFQLTNLNMEPLLLLMLSTGLHSYGCHREFKEVFKYPDAYSNALIVSILRKKYEHMVKAMLLKLNQPSFQKVSQQLLQYEQEPSQENLDKLSISIIDMEYHLPKRVIQIGLYTFHYADIEERIRKLKRFLFSIDYEILMDFFIKFKCSISPTY